MFSLKSQEKPLPKPVFEVIKNDSPPGEEPAGNEGIYWGDSYWNPAGFSNGDIVAINATGSGKILTFKAIAHQLRHIYPDIQVVVIDFHGDQSVKLKLKLAATFQYGVFSRPHPEFTEKNVSIELSQLTPEIGATFQTEKNVSIELSQLLPEIGSVFQPEKNTRIELSQLTPEIGAMFQNDLVISFDIFTPASDVSYAISEGDINLILGRSGDDYLLGFNPNIERTQLRVDLLSGDQDPGRLYFKKGSDIFVLGDWNQPYYDGSEQFAILTDFDPERDRIQLHGTANDYFLRNTDTGGELYLRQDNGLPDLIANILSKTPLNLRADYFAFTGTVAPEIVTNRIEQFGTDGFDGISQVAADLQGNLYFVGSTTGQIGETENLGSYDAVILKYDEQHQQVGVEQFGSLAPELLTDVTTDSQGNIYAVGISNTDFTAADDFDKVWLTKYDSDLNQQWLQEFSTGSQVSTYSFTVDLDSSGNIYLGGISVVVGQQDDPWVAKFDSTGNLQWQTEFGSSEADETYRVMADPTGEFLFATGWTAGDLGGENNGAYDVWLAKFDLETGEQLFIQQIGSSSYEFPLGIGIDSQSNVYISGWTLGDLGGQKNLGSYDGFIGKYDASGQLLWVNLVGTEGEDAITGMAIDAADNIYVSGFTDGNHNDSDAFAAKFDSDGNQQWFSQFGTEGFEQARDVTVGIKNQVYVAGLTDNSLGALNAGSLDSWVAELNPFNGAVQEF